MNLLPGQGLGFSGSQLLGFGLGAVSVTEVPVPCPPEFGGGGGGGGGGLASSSIRVYDNAYSRGMDDEEIMLILSHIIQVIE